MYDPLVPMLRGAGGTPAGTRDASCGIFEYMPFRDGLFDAVMCGYSLRVAINLENAISEIHRVLRDGGKLIIADLGKPDCAAARIGISLYLWAVLPVIALTAGGRLGLKFTTLYGTYRRWPRNADLRRMLRERFSKVEFETDLMGGEINVAAYK